jgi:CheY-like chemotaxis protein
VLDLHELGRELSKLLVASICYIATRHTQFWPGGAVVEGDATQLRQVVMNLILNASDAVDGTGGEITLSAGVAHSSKAFLQATWLHDDLPEGDYAYVEVADTGPGMDEATRARVFEPFFTSKRSGSGLGLAAVQGIVRSHRGFIELESHPGAGTRFRVGLPHCRLPVPERPEKAAPGPWDDRGGVILVADDERAVRVVVRGSLEPHGFQVLEAVDGESAVDVFAGQPSAIRAVFLDLTMPALSGDEAFKRIREIDAGVPVVLMSGYDEGDVIRRFDGGGPSGFLQKPFGPDDVLELLQRVLHPTRPPRRQTEPSGPVA